MKLIAQIASLVGAILMLSAYLALQRGWMSREERRFSALNLVGASLLTFSAVIERNLGFILVEGCWALMSIEGTLRRSVTTNGHQEVSS